MHVKICNNTQYADKENSPKQYAKDMNDMNKTTTIRQLYYNVKTKI